VLGWYVLHSKPQKEKWLYKQLNALEIEVYYPCLNTKNGKLKTYTGKPYFPGYLFVNLDFELTGMSMVKWIPGSQGLVSFGDEPACVPEGLLQRIRQRVDEINGAEEHILNRLKPGDQVKINSGPFAGYEAIFCAQLRGSERVQVLLKVLQDRAIRIDLPVQKLAVTKQIRT
jgi:transcription elongation factor/antiterminator RfaH